VRIEVAEGDTVAAGQGVVIVEAMKMENELKAGAEARVSRVLVEEGQPVEKGQLLIDFEPIDDGSGSDGPTGSGPVSETATG
jgi:biotin carboxyl carrier protein